MADPRVIEALIVALRDENATVRHYAASALGRYEDPHVVCPLIEALEDSDKDVRAGAALSLRGFREPEVLDALIARLDDPDPYVVWVAAGILSEIQDPRVIEPLVHSIDGISFYLMNRRPFSERNLQYRLDNPVLRGLIRMGELSVEPLLAALRRDSGDVNRDVIWALGQIGDPRAERPLRELLDDASHDVAEEISAALEHIAQRKEEISQEKESLARQDYQRLLLRAKDEGSYPWKGERKPREYWQSLSTVELADEFFSGGDLCMDMMILGDIFRGFDRLRIFHDGFAELLQREDAGQGFLHAYETLTNRLRDSKEEVTICSIQLMYMSMTFHEIPELSERIEGKEALFFQAYVNALRAYESRLDMYEPPRMPFGPESRAIAHYAILLAAPTCPDDAAKAERALEDIKVPYPESQGLANLRLFLKEAISVLEGLGAALVADASPKIGSKNPQTLTPPEPAGRDVVRAASSDGAPPEEGAADKALEQLRSRNLQERVAAVGTLQSLQDARAIEPSAQHQIAAKVDVYSSAPITAGGVSATGDTEGPATDSAPRRNDAAVQWWWELTPEGGFGRVAGEVHVFNAGRASLLVSPARGCDLSPLAALHPSTIQHLWLRGVDGVETPPDDFLAPLTKLEKLETLYLDHTNVTNAGLAPLARLKSLERLAVLEDGLNEAGMAHIAAMSWLKGLRIATDTTFSEASLSQLAKLTSLKALSLGWRGLQPTAYAHLAQMPSLEYLFLGGYRHGAEGIAQLARMPALRWLYIYDLSDDELAALPVIPSLRHLKFQGKGYEYTAAGFDNLSRLTGLESLTIYGRYRDDAIAALRPLPSLKHLTLFGLWQDRDYLTDNSLKHLSQFLALESLEIRTGHFTDDGLRYLLSLTNLKQLAVRKHPEITNVGSLREATREKQNAPTKSRDELES